MSPFLPNPDWYEKYWYSQKPAKKVSRAASVVASLAAFALAIWLR